MDEPKKIALALPFIDADTTDYLAEVVNQNWVTSGGPTVTKFEKQLQEFLQTDREVVALNSGTAALHLALKLLSEGMYDFIGTDTHHMRHVENLKKVKFTGKYEQDLDRIISNTTATFS